MFQSDPVDDDYQMPAFRISELRVLGRKLGRKAVVARNFRNWVVSRSSTYIAAASTFMPKADIFPISQPSRG